MTEDNRRRVEVVRVVVRVAVIVVGVSILLIVVISLAAPEGLFGAMWSTLYSIASIVGGIALGVVIIGVLYRLSTKGRR
jgi:NhaP-type Na+/H+ or K+/H+ antiporter